MQKAPAEVGSTANSYQILAKLAVGGMAEIFLAKSASVGGVERYVVLKRVLADRAADVEFIRMFLDEVRLAAQLQHPNIAQVYDVGKLGESYFFTMEYVHGETVRGLLHRAFALRKPLPIGNVLTVIANTAAGLHHAHERVGVDGRPLNIVHRDVSPSNLMVSYEGHVKVVDFGVAKASDRMQETRAGTVKGKIAYLAPEQCRAISSGVDRRADLFSLGIVMWEMLTTERLFNKPTDFDTMMAIVNDDVPPPGALRRDIPLEVDAIVKRLLAKDPADRYQTAAEVVDAIEEVAARSGSILSAAALGRQMKELFGQRPEPWVELQIDRKQPEIVTVTSEPLPAMITVAPHNVMEAQLASVPDLSLPPSGALHIPRSRPLSAIEPTVVPSSRPVMRLDPTPMAMQPVPSRSGLTLPLLLVGVAAAALIASVIMYFVMRSSAMPPPIAKDAAAVVVPVAIPIDAAPPDAAVIVDAAPPIDAEDLVDASAPDASTLDDILSAFAGEQYPQVVELCLAAPSIAEHGAACTMSACRTHKLPEARRWFPRVSQQRRALVISTCAKVGIQF